MLDFLPDGGEYEDGIRGLDIVKLDGIKMEEDIVKGIFIVSRHHLHLISSHHSFEDITTIS